MGDICEIHSGLDIEISTYLISEDNQTPIVREGCQHCAEAWRDLGYEVTRQPPHVSQMPTHHSTRTVDIDVYGQG